jgi:predicted phage terminase large subunit-like protein
MLSPLEGRVVMWRLKRRGVLHSAWGLKATKSRSSKVVRAATAATYLEQGKIWFPKKPWRDEWDTELVTFPHSRHDDRTDVLAYAAQQINTRRRHPDMTGWQIDPDLGKPPSR